MPQCNFCGKPIKPGTGKMFIFVSGKINYFCSSKCEKNQLKLKRKPLQARWTEFFKKNKNKSNLAEKVSASAKDQVDQLNEVEEPAE